MNGANARQTKRLGGLAFTFALTLGVMSISAPDLEVAIAIALGVAVGIGLMLCWRWLRWLVAAAMLVDVGASVYDLADWVRSNGDLPRLAIVNAVASSALLVWLSACAIRILLDRTPPVRSVTPRIAGAALAVTMATNLLLLPFDATGGASLGFSSAGTTVFGFVGWPIIDGVIGLAGLALLLGSMRIAKHAATIVLIVAIAMPLIIVATARFGFAGDVVSITFMPIYLAWWLRASIGDALRT
jgi:hypothetical protein